MPENIGSMLIGLGAVAGISWLLWRAWHRDARGAPPIEQHRQLHEWIGGD